MDGKAPVTGTPANEAAKGPENIAKTPPAESAEKPAEETAPASGQSTETVEAKAPAIPQKTLVVAEGKTITYDPANSSPPRPHAPLEQVG